MNLAGWTRKLSGKPVITVGSIGLETDFVTAFATKGPINNATQHLDRLVEMFANSEIDLAAVGRALISDPAWATKLKAGTLNTATPFSREALASLV